MIIRNYTLFDKFCLQCDQGLQVLRGVVKTTGRRNPADAIAEQTLDPKQRRHAAALMRVNHVGEICAQALYQGQALTAYSGTVRNEIQHAAQEENDHLDWCAQRLHELNSRPSYLNPLWYMGSFAMGTLSGLLGDAYSLGFIVETEHQVEMHLASHLQKLPESDAKSRAIVAQMQLDEAKHGATAKANGAVALPIWIKTIMRFQAKLMTTTAYWF